MSCSPDPDLQIVYERMLAALLLPPPGTGEVERLVAGMAADGSWPDIDYADQDRSYWKAMVHLQRLLVLARARKCAEHPGPGGDRLRWAVAAALDLWLVRDLINPNWWYNQIGAPGALSQSLLLLAGELTPAQCRKGLEILGRANMEQENMTGQNLVWIADLRARRGLLAGDVGTVAAAFSRIAAEIEVSTAEGIQADCSFHQHGAVLYSHGYGAGFAADCSRIAALVAGTRFAFPPERIELLTSLVLDGHQWFARGIRQDFGAIGREIARAGHNAAFLRQVADDLLALPTGREPELRALAVRLADRGGPALVGNRHFWRSDIMVHQRPGYYASARMHSDRLGNTDDPCNDEGLKSHHLADGATCLLRTGQEYLDIFPVWDWRKIPGTTVLQDIDMAPPVRRQGTRPFAGGVTDGRSGLAAFDFERDGLRARKCWLFCDDTIVCLGAGISCPADRPVVTTVNQCILSGVIVTSAGTLNAGSHHHSDLRWVNHDRIGYFLLQPADVGVENQVRTGSWWEISRSTSKEPVEQRVFTLWIDHGVRPNEATYQYAVSPGVPVSAMITPAVEVVANTPDLQAVRHRQQQVIGAACYQPGSVEVGPGWTVSVDQPCLLLLRVAGETLELSICSPQNLESAVTWESSRPLAGVGVEAAGSGSRGRVDLAGGQHAGRSVTRRLQLRP